MKRPCGRKNEERQLTLEELQGFFRGDRFDTDDRSQRVNFQVGSTASFRSFEDVQMQFIPRIAWPMAGEGGSNQRRTAEGAPGRSTSPSEEAAGTGGDRRHQRAGMPR